MLSRSEILTKLKEILVAMDPSKEGTLDNVNESSRLVEDLGLMSISLIFMAISIEEKFQIELGDVSISDFNTVGDTIDHIQKCLK